MTCSDHQTHQSLYLTRSNLEQSNLRMLCGDSSFSGRAGPIIDRSFWFKSFGLAALKVSAMVRGLLRTSNLPQLQNLIKRDPVSYKEEFLQQWNHYNSTRQIFQINPAEQPSHFRELVTFISQVRIYSCIVCGPNSSV